MKFFCITNGIITSNKGEGSERCAIRLFELDDLGDYKEPIYVPPSKVNAKIRKKNTRYISKDGIAKPVNVRYRTLDTNQNLAVSLVELETSVTKWSFIQCFLAYKATFVLGDTFFSRRVKHILGQPIPMTPTKFKTVSEIRKIDYSNEPLPPKLQKLLNVRHNNQLPLMIHCAGLTFPGLAKKKCKDTNESSQNKWEEVAQSTATLERLYKVKLMSKSTNSEDIIITADQHYQIPPHFTYTLERLKLDSIFIKNANNNEITNNDNNGAEIMQQQEVNI